jgi:hypothetical protein
MAGQLLHMPVFSAPSRRPRVTRQPADSLFCSKEEAARLLGMSVGGLGLAMQRGECEGLYTRLGRRILFCLPAIQLRALGVTDAGAFCRSLGIRNMNSLLEFLNGEEPACGDKCSCRK